jgi:DNL zinc finger
MGDREIVWTCLKCRLRNTSEVATDITKEKSLVVRCKGCEREQTVSPALVLTSNGTKMRVGVTWL